MIHSLFGLNESQRSLVGDKALRLSWLRQQGLQVPEGFVVDTAVYRETLLSGDLGDMLLNIADERLPQTYSELERFSAFMYQEILDLELPESLVDEIRHAWEEMGSPAVIVRPSALENAVPDANLSGRPRGFSNLNDLESILQAIHLTWASLWSADAISHRQRMGISGANIAMAVIIQRFMVGSVSGLLFTANPRTNRSDQIVIRSVWGLGEAIVRDEVRPDHWVFDTNGAVYQANITVKNDIRQVDSEKGTVLNTIPNHLRTAATLEKSQMSELLSSALQISRAIPGEPQILEWTYDQRQLYFLQLRPISGMYPSLKNTTADDRPSSEKRVYLLLNAMAGTYQPLSPLGASLWQEFILRLSEDLTRSITGKPPLIISNIGGRLWLDITNELLSRRTKEALLSGLEEHRPAAAALIKRSLSERKNELRLLTQPFTIPKLRLMLRTGLAGFFSPIKAAFRLRQRGENQLAAMREEAEYISDLDSALAWLDRNITAMTQMVLEQASYYLPGYLAWRWIRDKTEKWQEYSLNINILRQQRNNTSSEIMRVLFNASSFFLESGQTYAENQPQLQLLLVYLNAYGNFDLDPGSPRWSEEKYLLENFIEIFAKTKNDPEQQIQALRNQAQIVCDLLPKYADKHGGTITRWQMKNAVKIVDALAGAHQQIILNLTQIMALIRKLFLQIGEALTSLNYLESPEDIFYLSLDDLRGTVNSLSHIVRQNRQEYALEAMRESVPLLLFSNGEAVYPELSDLPGNQLSGFALSNGEYTGYIRILNDNNLSSLERGEIAMIQDFRSSMLTALLYAGAIVFEQGEENSYVNLAGRSLGVPAIANVKQASQRLRTGMKVHLNGYNGMITILAAPRSETETASNYQEETLPSTLNHFNA